MIELQKMFFPSQRLFLSFFPNDSFFLPNGSFFPKYIKLESEFYNIDYTPKPPKFLLLITVNVLPQFKKLQTLIFLIEFENQNPNFFYGIGVGHGRKTRLMEKVQSMVKAKENDNDEGLEVSVG